jgi:hypothetical protein
MERMTQYSAHVFGAPGIGDRSDSFLYGIKSLIQRSLLTNFFRFPIITHSLMGAYY